MPSAHCMAPPSSDCRAKSKKRAFTQYAKKYESKAEIEEALDELRKHASVIRVLAHTQIKKVELRQRKAHLMEIQVGCPARCRLRARPPRQEQDCVSCTCGLPRWASLGAFWGLQALWFIGPPPACTASAPTAHQAGTAPPLAHLLHGVPLCLTPSSLCL